jgi:hypothetical protein
MYCYHCGTSLVLQGHEKYASANVVVHILEYSGTLDLTCPIPKVSMRNSYQILRQLSQNSCLQ